MILIEEIRKYFASLTSGMLRLDTLPDEYPGYIVRDSYGYGVAVEIGPGIEISELFANAHLYTCEKETLDGPKRFLVIQSYREDLRIEFASVCAQFLDPGKDGEDRRMLVEQPEAWWKHWKELLGNAIGEAAVYSVIAEMLALEHIYQTDKTVVWSNSGSATHDLECADRSIEVKSTIQKYAASMTVSGQFQLKSKKPLGLLFCRMEPSPNGDSINDVAARLIALGYDQALLEEQLRQRKYEKGKIARNEKYAVLEKRKYEVDDNFPKIVDASFKGDKIPHAINHITYTVDLDAITYTPW